MKILQILTDTNIGGAGRYLMALLANYDRSSFQMEVILPIGSRLTPELTALDVPVLEVPYIGDRSFSVKAVGVLYRLMGKRKPDIVNTHASLSGRLAAKLRGMTVIHTRHHCVGGKDRVGFINNFLSDKIIAVSPEVEAGLIKSGTKPSHIITIYNGVPPVKTISQEKKDSIRARYGIKADSFVISQIARLDPVKGHDHTLDAAKLLIKEPSIVILLAGDGPMQQHLKRRIKEENIKNVVMAGFIPAVEEIFGITDLQVNASYTEATCLALLEGMSQGIPAIATKVGGNPFVISHGQNGLLVPPKNGDALGSAALKLKNDPKLYSQLSLGADREYNNRFRADIMARSIESLYRGELE